MRDLSTSNAFAVYQYLLENSDEDHKVMMSDILSYLDGKGYQCSPDTVRRTIRQINTELPVEVVIGRGRGAGYFMTGRVLDKDELRLVIDAVNASNFIEADITAEIDRKLKGTQSRFCAKELERSVMGVTVAKSENKKILYNVNAIQEALKDGVQISFDYVNWDKDKKLVKKNKDKKYTMNPWALIWANDRYYLYGYDVEETDGVRKDRNYRVDKMSNITPTKKKREGREQFEGFDATTYVSRRMGMFSGREESISVKIPEKLVGAFIDQFGKKRVAIEDLGDGELRLTFTAVPSGILLGWLMGLGECEVLGPEKVRNDMASLIAKNARMYT